MKIFNRNIVLVATFFAVPVIGGCDEDNQDQWSEIDGIDELTDEANPSLGIHREECGSRPSCTDLFQKCMDVGGTFKAGPVKNAEGTLLGYAGKCEWVTPD